MQNRHRRASLAYGLLLLLAASLVTGCVIVPYKPSARVWDSAGVALDPALVLVTAVRRELLEEVGDAIRSQDNAITVVDPQIFADSAFPDDDVRLSRLLTAPACARVREQTAADYLVLVGTPETETVETQGAFGVVPYFLFLGAGTQSEEATNFAIIFDLKAVKPLSSVSSLAGGTRLAVGYFFALLVEPLTESGAMDGLGRGVVARLRKAAGPGALTIAVMGAEPVPGKGGAALTVAGMTGGAIEGATPGPRMIAARAAEPRFKAEPGPEPASSNEAVLIRSIQEGLRRVGYTWVPVDGRLGSWTRAAIRDFQSSSEYTGRFVDELPSEQLRVDIERAIPKWAPVMQLRPQSKNDGQQ